MKAKKQKTTRKRTTRTKVTTRTSKKKIRKKDKYVETDWDVTNKTTLIVYVLMPHQTFYHNCWS